MSSDTVTTPKKNINLYPKQLTPRKSVRSEVTPSYVPVISSFDSIEGMLRRALPSSLSSILAAFGDNADTCALLLDSKQIGRSAIVFFGKEGRDYEFAPTAEGMKLVPSTVERSVRGDKLPLILDPRQITPAALQALFCGSDSAGQAGVTTASAAASSSSWRASSGQAAAGRKKAAAQFVPPKGQSGKRASGKGASGGDEDGEGSDEDSDGEGNEKPSSKDTRAYNDGIASAVSERFDLPNNIAISSLELLTYFPKHAALWPELLLRLCRNDFSLPECAVRQLYARGNLDKAEFTRRYAALRKAVKTAGERKFNDPNFTLTSYKSGPNANALMQPFSQTDVVGGNIEHLYHVNRMVPPAAPPPNVPLNATRATLSALVNGVTQHPPPGHRGVLTKCILWAITNGVTANYDTHNLNTIVNMAGNNFLPDPGANTLRWDQDGFANTQGIPRP